MTTRTNTEVDHSKWPVYVAQKSHDFPNWLIVTCPREGCGQSFLVLRKNWYGDKKEFATRACPYCFKANKLPKPRDILREKV